MENRQSYADKLIELRKKKGVSRAEVAKAVGVTRSAIAMYEQGKRMPKDNIKTAISKYYSKSIGYIFYS